MNLKISALASFYHPKHREYNIFQLNRKSTTNLGNDCLFLLFLSISLWIYLLIFHGRYTTNRPKVVISKNNHFSPMERDIIIIMLDSECRSHRRYSVQELMPVMTRARKAIFICGDLKSFEVSIALFAFTFLFWTSLAQKKMHTSDSGSPNAFNFLWENYDWTDVDAFFLSFLSLWLLLYVENRKAATMAEAKVYLIFSDQANRHELLYVCLWECLISILFCFLFMN